MRYFPLLLPLASLALTAYRPEIFVNATATPADSGIGITHDKNCALDPDKGANHHAASHADFDSDAGPLVNPHIYPKCDTSQHTG